VQPVRQCLLVRQLLLQDPGDGDGVAYGPLVDPTSPYEMSHGVTAAPPSCLLGRSAASTVDFGHLRHHGQVAVSSPSDVPVPDQRKALINNPGNSKAFRYMYHPSPEVPRVRRIAGQHTRSLTCISLWPGQPLLLLAEGSGARPSATARSFADLQQFQRDRVGRAAAEDLVSRS
jgi:hypothetical protein